MLSVKVPALVGPELLSVPVNGSKVKPEGSEVAKVHVCAPPVVAVKVYVNGKPMTPIVGMT